MPDLDPDRLAAHARWLDTGGAEGTRLVAVGEDLSGADLSGANLADADFSYVFAPGADLHGADLTGADLKKADLSLARLSGAVLHRASCVRTDLSGADLTGADLSRAHLVKTFAADADLAGASLVDADVDRLLAEGARIDAARVTGLRGHLGFATDEVLLAGEGPPRTLTLAELATLLNERGADVDALPGDARPDPVPWRWEQPD